MPRRVHITTVPRGRGRKAIQAIFTLKFKHLEEDRLAQDIVSEGCPSRSWAGDLDSRKVEGKQTFGGCRWEGENCGPEQLVKELTDTFQEEKQGPGDTYSLF